MDTLLAAARSTESSGSGSEEPPAAPAGKPEQKRKKVSLACARCKRRKGKCDGIMPSCGPCSAVGATCEWPDPTSDGRKRRKGSALHYQLQQTAAAQQAAAEASQVDELDEDEEAPPQPTPTFALPPTSAVSLPLPSAPLPPNPLPAIAPPLPPPVARAVEQPFAEAATPKNDKVPFLNYYRPFGPTALKSGVEEIRIDIAAAPTFSRAVSPTGFAPSAPHPFPSAAPPFISSDPAPSFSSATQGRDSDRFYDLDGDMPKPEILDHLYPIFFARMGSLFPSLSLPFLESLNSSNSYSQHSLEGPVLASAVCALAARFSTSPLIRGSDEDRPPACFGVPFAEKAKALLLPLLCFPSGITITTLLLLSYHEKGMNSEGSQWMYLGMSIRMAQDLGLQLSIVRLPHNQYECSTASLLWWSIMNLDHQLSLGIGRCTTVKAAEISIPYPTDDDIAISRRGPSGGFPFVASSLPSPFPVYVKLMAIVGQLCDIVNLTKGTWGGTQTSQRREAENEYAEKGPSLADPPMDEPADPSKTLKTVEDSLTELYSALPAQLQWSSQNFREHMNAGTGPIYLHLHLWYHAAFIMMYRPPLLYPNCYAADLSLTERLSVVSNSASTISQILSCCDMSDENPIVSCPFINLPFYVAGQAWSQDWRIRTGKKVLSTSTTASPAGAAGGPASSSSSRILAQVALTNFDLCKSALKTQSSYWLGIRWVLAVLEKSSSRQSIMSATEGINTFVSRHELAVFKRLAQRISGQAATPDLDSQYLSSLFHTLQETDLTSMDYNFSQDDFALAYTFAGSFPDPVDFGGLNGVDGF